MAEDKAPDDQREKFLLALEAKKNKGQQGAQPRGGTSASGKDASNKAGGKREHRRKSG